jgi:phosphoribosyl-ATP pyrophosphohydrolase/phosphoribosyl-AMP cyclohydrolase
MDAVRVPEDLRFDANGLIPAIAQDGENGQVLMHAYMNAEALAKTLETGFVHYFSRSRGRLWRKGEESGHVQRVRAIRYDCDADTLLLDVEQTVAACHTGHRSCFYRRLEGAERELAPAGDDAGRLGVLERVYGTIQDRRRRRPEGSYVTTLLAKGPDAPLKKVAEEAAEVLLAAKAADRGQVIYEVADLWFHSLVVLAQMDIRPDEIAGELERRMGKQKAEYA